MVTILTRNIGLQNLITIF